MQMAGIGEENLYCRGYAGDGTLPGAIDHMLVVHVAAEVFPELWYTEDGAGCLVLEGDQKHRPDGVHAPGERPGILPNGSRLSIFGSRGDPVES
jgi:hypothetical protein